MVHHDRKIGVAAGHLEESKLIGPCESICTLGWAQHRARIRRHTGSNDRRLRHRVARGAGTDSSLLAPRQQSNIATAIHSKK